MSNHPKITRLGTGKKLEMGVETETEIEIEVDQDQILEKNIETIKIRKEIIRNRIKALKKYINRSQNPNPSHGQLNRNLDRNQNQNPNPNH